MIESKIFLYFVVVVYQSLTLIFFTYLQTDSPAQIQYIMVQRRTDISFHNDSTCNAIYYGEQLAFIK